MVSSHVHGLATSTVRSWHANVTFFVFSLLAATPLVPGTLPQPRAVVGSAGWDNGSNSLQLVRGNGSNSVTVEMEELKYAAHMRQA